MDCRENHKVMLYHFPVIPSGSSCIAERAYECDRLAPYHTGAHVCNIDEMKCSVSGKR